MGSGYFPVDGEDKWAIKLKEASRMSGRYAKNTTVPVDRSIAEIERLMPTCEKCWAEAGGDPELYNDLLTWRRCSPEEQAGRDATECLACHRKAVHQHCHVCMACGGRGRREMAMTYGEIDGLLLKHVFREDPDKPRAWYSLFLRGGRFLCECWAGIGLVVEEMGKEEPPWHLLLEYDEDEWRAVFQNQDFRKWEDALHPTLAPMAVSLAALRAVGVEIPEEEVPR